MQGEGIARYAITIMCVISLATMLSTGMRVGKRDTNEPRFSIVTDYPGMDAEEVEQTVTIPLEHELSSLQDVLSITATSGYSRSTITIRGKGPIEQASLRRKLKDKIDRARGQFPRAVRKPRITASDSSRAPVYVAVLAKQGESLESIGKFVEREVKPRYASVQGVGEVMITGSTHDEITVHIDAEKAVPLGVHSLIVADTIARSNEEIPCGSIIDLDRNIPILYTDGILGEDDIASVRFSSPSGKSLRISELCSTRRRHATPDRIGRINGNRGILVSIYSGIGTNTVSLCQDLSLITKSLQASGLTIKEIHNQGIDDTKQLLATGLSLLVGLTVIAGFLAISVAKFANVLILTSLLPFLILLTVALLSALRITIDTGILAGLSIGSGMAVDNFLVVQTKASEHIEASKQIISLTCIRKALYPLISPLISTTLTTIIVFIPLRMMRESSTFLGPLSMTLSLMISISLPLAFFCIPRPLYALSCTRRRAANHGTASRPSIIGGSSRVFLNLAGSSRNNPISYAIVCGFLILSSLCLITLSEREVSSLSQDPVVFIHVETGAGCSIEETDARVSSIIDTLALIKGTITTEADSRRENASILLRYDPSVTSREDYERNVRSICDSIRYAQLFPSLSQSSSTMETTLTVTGHHRPTLRKITLETGAYFSRLPWVKGVVYRFREGSPTVTFTPDRDAMCKTGIQTQYVANLLTWNIQGPVASKILSKGNEIDIRVFSDNGETLDAMRKSIALGTEGQPIPLASIGSFTKGTDDGRLYRSGMQNSLSFTIETERIGLSRLTKLLETSLADLNTPTGFFILPDPGLREMVSEYRSMIYALAFACFLVYAILVAQTASFTKPLLILASIPLSAFLPLFALRLCGFPISPAVIVALVMLSGMAVNNSILILDSIRATSADSLGSDDSFEANDSDGCLNAIRIRYPALFLTSATTVLSSIPIAITSRGFSSFPGTLALVAGLGTAGSFLASFLFIPAILSLLSVPINKRKPGQERL